MGSLGMKKILSLVLFVGTLSGNISHAESKGILGTSMQASGEILLDAKIGGLRIRHVRYPTLQCTSNFAEGLELSGSIGPDSTEAVERLLPRLAKCVSSETGSPIPNLVYLSSRGGVQADGYRLGRLFRSHRLQTQVGDGALCASSCALAFLGGSHRIMLGNAELLFHAPYTVSQLSNRADCSDRGQVDELRDYFVSMLGPDDGNYLLKRTMDYCSTTTGWTLNSDGAKLFNIVNAEVFYRPKD